MVLLLVGFTEPTRSPESLVSSYLTVSPLPAARTGGLFSVALSLRSPSLGITQHHALWSSDFPPVLLEVEPAAIWSTPACADTVFRSHLWGAWTDVVPLGLTPSRSRVSFCNEGIDGSPRFGAPRLSSGAVCRDCTQGRCRVEPPRPRARTACS